MSAIEWAMNDLRRENTLLKRANGRLTDNLALAIKALEKCAGDPAHDWCERCDDCLKALQGLPKAT